MLRVVVQPSLSLSPSVLEPVAEYRHLALDMFTSVVAVTPTNASFHLINGIT